MIYFLLVIVLVVLFTIVFLRQDKFGHNPSGKRLKIIQNSPHYKDGSFKNLSHTPDLTEGVTYWQVFKEFFLIKKERLRPESELPSLKTNLKALDPTKHILIWFGHSSYFILVDGISMLVDPVLSGHASPVSFTTKAFAGTGIYNVEDLPEIDYLFITHDHWDHLDYDTVRKLRNQVKHVICGLGVGSHFKQWGYNSNCITELDWHDTLTLALDLKVQVVPARHFSGRGLQRNKTLWVSYALKTPSLNLFLGGDSGYDSHFKKAGESLGPFDVVILENGQYNYKWKYIHMQPEEVIKAAQDLKAKNLLAVHSGKFALAEHPWDEPLHRISNLSEQTHINLLTPKIGEPVFLGKNPQVFEKWWQTKNL